MRKQKLSKRILATIIAIMMILPLLPSMTLTVSADDRIKPFVKEFVAISDARVTRTGYWEEPGYGILGLEAHATGTFSFDFEGYGIDFQLVFRGDPEAGTMPIFLNGASKGGFTNYWDGYNWGPGSGVKTVFSDYTLDNNATHTISSGIQTWASPGATVYGFNVYKYITPAQPVLTEAGGVVTIDNLSAYTAGIAQYGDLQYSTDGVNWTDYTGGISGLGSSVTMTLRYAGNAAYLPSEPSKAGTIGEPGEVCPDCGKDPCECEEPVKVCGDCGKDPCKCVISGVILTPRDVNKLSPSPVSEYPIGHTGGWYVRDNNAFLENLSGNGAVFTFTFIGRGLDIQSYGGDEYTAFKLLVKDSKGNTVFDQTEDLRIYANSRCLAFRESPNNPPFNPNGATVEAIRAVPTKIKDFNHCGLNSPQLAAKKR